MNRDDFFRHVIDGYLFLDLRNMSELEQKDGENGGGVGYPMLATCVSGMELLGGLLHGKDYNRKRDWDYFEHYWNEYLVKVDARYAPFANLFWKLVRNGVAHTYMAKAAITVTKGQAANHLVFYDDGSKFNIDCRQFYKDFSASYEQQVKPKQAADDAFTAQVQKNIDTMLKESGSYCEKIFVAVRSTATRVPQNPPSSANPASIATNRPTTTTLIPDDVREKLAQDFRSNVSSTSRISGASLASPEAIQALKRKLEQDEEPRPTMSGTV